MDKVKILVADDDPLMQDSYRRMLRSFDTQIVSGGLRALDLIRRLEFKPDIIFSDYDMGVGYMNGVTFCSDLRIAGDKTPFVLISGNGAVRTLAAGCGANYGLEKPFHKYQLLRLIEKLVPNAPRLSDGWDDETPPAPVPQ